MQLRNTACADTVIDSSVKHRVWHTTTLPQRTDTSLIHNAVYSYTPTLFRHVRIVSAEQSCVRHAQQNCTRDSFIDSRKFV